MCFSTRFASGPPCFFVTASSDAAFHARYPKHVAHCRVWKRKYQMTTPNRGHRQLSLSAPLHRVPKQDEASPARRIWQRRQKPIPSHTNETKRVAKQHTHTRTPCLVGRSAFTGAEGNGGGSPGTKGVRGMWLRNSADCSLHAWWILVYVSLVVVTFSQAEGHVLRRGDASEADGWARAEMEACFHWWREATSSRVTAKFRLNQVQCCARPIIGIMFVDNKSTLSWTASEIGLHWQCSAIHCCALY